MKERKSHEEKVLDELKLDLGRAAVMADLYFEYTGSPIKAEISIELQDDKWVHVARIQNDGIRE